MDTYQSVSLCLLVLVSVVKMLITCVQTRSYRFEDASLSKNVARRKVGYGHRSSWWKDEVKFSSRNSPDLALDISSEDARILLQRIV